jgi:hypothetical protein
MNYTAACRTGTDISFFPVRKNKISCGNINIYCPQKKTNGRIRLFLVKKTDPES